MNQTLAKEYQNLYYSGDLCKNLSYYSCLESDYQSYKARMKQFINGQMDILDNPVYEMEFEIAGCEQTDGDEEDEQQKQFGNEQ